MLLTLGTLGFPVASGVGDYRVMTHESMKARVLEVNPKDWLTGERDPLYILLFYTS